jgi:hypothetical protein
MEDKDSNEIGTAVKVADYHLVVKHPFGTYRKGDMITDADEVADVLAGPNKHQVNKVRAS